MAEGTDFTFETINASEHDRLQTLYTPLTQAVRRLIQAGIRTGADEETIREAQTAIEAVVEKLEGTVEDEVAQVRLAVDGRPVVWGNPVTGFRNAVAPPLVMHEEPDGLWWSEFELGEAYQGPPGWVHGGVLALVLDQLLGDFGQHCGCRNRLLERQRACDRVQIGETHAHRHRAPGS